MKCLNCNNKIPNNSNFCEFCGIKVLKKFEDLDLEVTNDEEILCICPKCGNRIDDNNKYILLSVNSLPLGAIGNFVYVLVYVDDKLVGILFNGASLSTFIKTGSHKVKLIFSISKAPFFSRYIYYRTLRNYYTIYRNFTALEDVNSVCYEIINSYKRIISDPIFNYSKRNNELDSGICPYCNYNLNSKKAFLILNKNFSNSDELAIYNVFLDNNIIGTLGNGQTIKCYVDIGKHFVTLKPMIHSKYLKKESRTYEFNVLENTNEVIMNFTRTIAFRPGLIDIVYK